MAQRRCQGPYIWATTLAKLLTGANSCEWAGWFKAHQQNWTKPASGLDSTNWMLEHTAPVNDEKAAKDQNKKSRIRNPFCANPTEPGPAIRRVFFVTPRQRPGRGEKPRNNKTEDPTGNG